VARPERAGQTAGMRVLMGEVRYNSLAKENPTHFKELFEAAQKNALWRLNGYKRLASQVMEIPAAAAK